MTVVDNPQGGGKPPALKQNPLAWFFVGPGMSEDDVWQKDSRRQYLGVLRTNFTVAQKRLSAGELEQKKDITDRVAALLKANDGLPGWRDSFEAEQLICFLQTGPLVDTEIRNRLSDAQAKGRPGTADRTTRFNELMALPAAQADEEKQALLFALVSDSQRASQKDFQVRQMRLDAVQFVMGLAIFAVILMCGPLLLYVLHLVTHSWGGWVSGFVDTLPNYGLFTAITFGILGALFSRFVMLQSGSTAVPVDEAAAYYSQRYILLRIFIGMVGAIIVYFFLASGLIQGDLIPHIQTLTFVASTPPSGVVAIPPATTPQFFTVLGTPTTTAMVPGKDFALLIVWSFLAGFSESLVPNLLDDTTKRIDEASKKAALPK